MKKLLTLLLASCLISSPAAASCGARGFGTTFGVGTTDAEKAGYSSGITSNTISMHARVWVNGSATMANAVIINQYNSASVTQGMFLAYASATPEITFGIPFSTTPGFWTAATSITNGWHDVVVTYNSSSTSNVPIIYIDGVSVTVATSTAPVGTVTVLSGNYWIGNREDIGKVFDGKLADLAVWNGTILTANEAMALGKGYSPLKIRRAALSMYIPNCGVQSSEPDWASRLTQTFTGTKMIAGPPDQGYPALP
jgi:hypothetical protein